MSEALEDLLSVLDLERIEVNLFRGSSPDLNQERVFGGQVLSQALVAAGRTVPDDRAVHSFHCYFLRAGDPKAKIVYEVDRIRDGKSFTTRRVVALQHGKAIFSGEISFQRDETGLEHQDEMPVVTSANDLLDIVELAKQHVDLISEKERNILLRVGPIEMRPVDQSHDRRKRQVPTKQATWMRVRGSMGGAASGHLIHQAILAYMSDHTLLSASIRPHRKTIGKRPVQVASLDHAMWFHAPFTADEWLLYVTDSSRASNARGMNFGQIFTQDGRLVASTAQESQMRLLD